MTVNMRKLTSAEEPAAKDVWKVCFADSEAFIDEYFKKIVRYEDTLGYYEGEELLADLFMLKFQAKFAGRFYAADFLAGCATLPRARKRGLMKELVRSAMLDMRGRGLCVTYLHPFLHSFYRNFGYETIAYIKRHTAQPCMCGETKLTTCYSSMQNLPMEKMYQAYCRYMDRFDNCFLRDSARFSNWLALLFADKGQAAVYENPGTGECAYALFYLEDGAADMFELACADQKTREKLFDAVPAAKANYFLPAGAHEQGSEEFTMMRVLDPIAALQNARLHAYDFTIAVEDDFLGEKYSFLVGKGDDGKNIVSKIDTVSADIAVPISALAALIAGAQPTYPDVFPRQSACFFETY